MPGRFGRSGIFDFALIAPNWGVEIWGIHLKKLNLNNGYDEVF